MTIHMAKLCVLAGFMVTCLGCTGGTGRINPSDQQRIELKNLPVIQAVHWQHGEGPIPIVQYNPGLPHATYLTDPITTVKEQLLESFAAHHGFTNIQSVEAPVLWPYWYSLVAPCCIQRGMGELQDLFGNAHIFEFASVDAFLSARDPYHVDWGFRFDLWLRPKMNLYFGARARIIHLESRTVVWQGHCQVAALETLDEWREQAEWSKVLLEEQLSVAAKKCAAQLLEQFKSSGPAQFTKS